MRTKEYGLAVLINPSGYQIGVLFGSMKAITEEVWPELPYATWQETYSTLHMWLQVVGKVALACAPPLNHSWSTAMDVTPRGLSTKTLPHGERTFSIQFDFIDHHLVIRTSDNETRTLVLCPQTVAEFYRELMAPLGAMEPLASARMVSQMAMPMISGGKAGHQSWSSEALSSGIWARRASSADRSSAVLAVAMS